MENVFVYRQILLFEDGHDLKIKVLANMKIEDQINKTVNPEVVGFITKWNGACC